MNTQTFEMPPLLREAVTIARSKMVNRVTAPFISLKWLPLLRLGPNNLLHREIFGVPSRTLQRKIPTLPISYGHCR